ncbi:MAG: elongation factor P [Candidatus Omnitrophota bacterium]|nr:elongation factor P [Candidatus Omnitrophota bacterium]
MALSINQLKGGLTILMDGEVYMLTEYQHVKPGKGAAFVRTKLKNLKTENLIEKTFKSDDKIEEAFVEERKAVFQYRAGDLFHFMEQEGFEEVAVSKDNLKEAIKFLKDNLEVSLFFFKNQFLKINLPNFIDFEIKETEPGIKGDTAKSGTKPAKIETGAVVQVPLFVNIGDRIKLDIRTGQYVERI